MLIFLVKVKCSRCEELAYQGMNNEFWCNNENCEDYCKTQKVSIEQDYS